MDNIRQAKLLETVEHFNVVENIGEQPEEIFEEAREEQEIEDPSHIVAQSMHPFEERFFCNIGDCDFK